MFDELDAHARAFRTSHAQIVEKLDALLDEADELGRAIQAEKITAQTPAMVVYQEFLDQCLAGIGALLQQCSSAAYSAGNKTRQIAQTPPARRSVELVRGPRAR